MEAKQHKGKFSKDSDRRTKNRLKAVYSDVCGLMQVDFIGGNRYFITFIDDHSRNLWTCLIKRKDEVLEVFNNFKSMVERESGQKLKVHKTDGGGEYVSNDFGKFCDQEGVLHEVVPPYTLWKNSVAERKNRLIMNMVRSMLNRKNMSKELWGEAVSIIAYLLNRCPTKKFENLTLEKAWSGFNPNLIHFRVFGSIAYQHVLGQLRKKLDDKGEVVILVGYHFTCGYKLFNDVKRRIVISWDIVTDELNQVQ